MIGQRLVRWRLWHRSRSYIRLPGIRTLLTTRTALILATGLLLLAMACGSSGSESSPSLVTTSTPVPTLPPATPTAAPTSTPEPTPTPAPTSAPAPTAMSKGAETTMSDDEDSLLPIAVFSNVSPEEIMSQFPAVERDCLKEHLSPDRMAAILQAAQPTIVEGLVIAGCLDVRTFVRVFMGSFLPESGTFSDATNACLTERMSDTELVRTAGLYIMTSMGRIDDFSKSFDVLPFMFCMNDDERVDADLDLDVAECLVDELDSADLQALAKLGQSDSPPPPPSVTAAMTKCGFTEPPS